MQEFLGWYFSTDKPEFWEDLHNEYVSLKANKNTAFVLDLMKEIAYLENQIFMIGQILTVISHIYNRELVLELKQMGFRGRFDWSNQPQYFADIKAANSASKRHVTQLQKKQAELKAYLDKFGGKEVTYMDFEDAAVEYGQYMGFNLEFEKVSVARWCSISNRYDRYLEVQNANANNLLTEKGYSNG